MFSTVSIIPGIENAAPDRTLTSSGSCRSPSRRPMVSSSWRSAIVTCTRSSPGSLPRDRYSRQASVVMVNPGGTGNPSLVISARFAPLPPSRSFWSLSPSVKSNTNLVIRFSLGRVRRRNGSRRLGVGSDRRRSNRTDAVAGSFVLWPGEKGGETHTAAGRVCLPPVVGDGWLGEPLGVGHFDSLVDAKCLPVYVHARHILLPLVRRSASGVRRLRPTDIKQRLQPPATALRTSTKRRPLDLFDTVRSAMTKVRVGACG